MYNKWVGRCFENKFFGLPLCVRWRIGCFITGLRGLIGSPAFIDVGAGEVNPVYFGTLWGALRRRGFN